MKKTQILFIGPIYPPETGPGIKNRYIINELKSTFIVTEINTLNKKITDFIRIFFCDVYLLSVSTNGRFLLGPIFCILAKIFRRKIILIPAGGNFKNELSSSSYVVSKTYYYIFKNYDKIYVQTPNLYKDLKSLGYNNVEYLTNLRPPYKRVDDYRVNNKFVYLSSIKKEKGIEDCVKAIDLLREHNKNVSLTIYGRVKDSYKEEFYDLLNKYDVEYKGLLSNDKVLDELCKYTALLLPTYYEGEGHPGVLVECSLVGLPFIITKFGEIDTIYKENFHANYVEKENPQAISNTIKKMLDNPDVLYRMNKELKNKSVRYHPKIVLKDLVSFINQN